MDCKRNDKYNTYEEPIDEHGYTHLAPISDNSRKYDYLKPSVSHHSYFEPQTDPEAYQTCRDAKVKSKISVISDNKSKCRIKLWIVFTTVIILACVLTAVLTYIATQYRNSTNVHIPSNESGNNENENKGFQISEIRAECPNDWKTFDNWCYKEFSERRTWFQARDYCRSIGTDLVSVHNERESNFLNNNFTQTFMWIGLSNFHNNGRYLWSDGTILNYTDWGQSEPNNVNNNENCAQTYYRKWNDNNCFMSFRFICKMQINPRCRPGDWIYYKNSCYLIDISQANFTEARSYCKNNGADLVIILSKEEYNFIVSHTSKQSSGGDFWIGLQKLRNQTYRWIDGSNPTYIPWRKEPQGDSDVCIKSSLFHGTWSGDSCTNTNRFICEKHLQ
ncbi:CD206 [Mytilus edulis]|uniref:MRC n=1 Tax=Mytilus edulis TaxID=6550 RepID=A0A8S3RL43_MYTED|nr:CD206 [Mytilus edulis]